jgi:hypothetical protein
MCWVVCVAVHLSSGCASQCAAGGCKYLCGGAPTIADLSSCEELLQVHLFFCIVYDFPCHYHRRIISAAVLRFLTRFAADGHSKRLLEVSLRCCMVERDALAARIRAGTRNFAGEDRSVCKCKLPLQPIQFLLFMFSKKNSFILDSLLNCIFSLFFFIFDEIPAARGEEKRRTNGCDCQFEAIDKFRRRAMANFTSAIINTEAFQLDLFPATIAQK